MENILIKAYEGKYSIPAINFESFEVVSGIIQGANKVKSPIIVQTTEPILSELGEKNIVNVIEQYKGLYQIPILLHLDHAESIDTVIKCIDWGYKSVMLDASNKEFDDNIKMTREVVDYAHKKNAIVEGELGIIGSDKMKSQFTDVSLVAEYTEKTKIDSLAVSVGSVHGIKTKHMRIDFSLLENICKCTTIPLVLHGSSGIVNHDLATLGQYGIAKINIETELRLLYKKTILDFYNEYPDEIRIRIINKYIKNSISSFVQRKCSIFGSIDKAKTW